jgi:prevent-host-death family protein
MKLVNMHSAKTHLSRLVEEAAGGEEIVIAKAGKPVARLVPIGAKKPSKIGFLKGKLRNVDDLLDAIDAPLPESLMQYFRGDK